MAIKLPGIPKVLKLDVELQRWLETMWEYVRPSVVTTGNTNASIGSGETYHGVTALTSGRTLTLPSASDMQDGDIIIIQDESGSAGTHTITIQASGSDTVSGTTTINTNYGRRTVIKRGTGKYFSQ